MIDEAFESVHEHPREVVYKRVAHHAHVQEWHSQVVAPSSDMKVVVFESQWAMRILFHRYGTVREDQRRWPQLAIPEPGAHPFREDKRVALSGLHRVRSGGMRRRGEQQRQHNHATVR